MPLRRLYTKRLSALCLVRSQTLKDVEIKWASHWTQWQLSWWRSRQPAAHSPTGETETQGDLGAWLRQQTPPWAGQIHTLKESAVPTGSRLWRPVCGWEGGGVDVLQGVAVLMSSLIRAASALQLHMHPRWERREKENKTQITYIFCLSVSNFKSYPGITCMIEWDIFG